MSKIEVKKPDKQELDRLGVEHWSRWGCEVSTFDWEYDLDETAYVLQGRVKVHTDEGTVEVGRGDLVTFPRGMKCRWEVLEPIRKVFRFGD